MTRVLMFLCALSLSTSAAAEPLTIRMGESWIFSIRDGQPAGARKVAGTAKPAKGQVMASARTFLGTSLTVINNSATAYTFSAQLLNGGKASGARACTLPAGGRPIFEQWEQKADAVRIGNFQAAGAEGRC